jgi:lipopolysaccharide biosynthesis glycosyltransferase
MTIRCFIGFDQREAAAYHVCCQSIIEKASEPVSFHPLARNMLAGFDGQGDGINAFTRSRFLVPSLCNFDGWALFIDGDMVVDIDIAELWAWRIAFSDDKAVGVVKHDYSTKHSRKYLGSKMESANVDYPRKNWSSVMLWNCAHPSNKTLTREFVANAKSSFLHRFQWLADAEIGEISPGWNYLVGEQAPSNAHLYHYTLGVPGIKGYADWNASWHWHAALLRALECAGEDPVAMVKRSQERIGAI